MLKHHASETMIGDLILQTWIWQKPFTLAKPSPIKNINFPMPNVTGTCEIWLEIEKQCHRRNID